MFNGILELLRSDGSIIINKAMARKIGIYETIVYSELVSKYIYYKNKESLFQFSNMDGEWFFSTIEDIEESIPMTAYEQRKAITKLKEIGLIDHTNKKPTGFANQTRFFQIKEDINLILSLLSDNKELKNKKTLETIENSRKLKNLVFESENNEFSKVKNFNTNNTNINNTNIINKDIVGQPDHTHKLSHLDDKKEKDNEHKGIIQEVITYLNEKTNKEFKTTTYKYTTLITSLLEKGYTVADMKKVIDIKCTWWLDDDNMKVYLRPTTLFGNKFDEYLNEQPKVKDNKIIHTKFKKDETYKDFEQRKYDKSFFDSLYKEL
jgi:uncharacterized phage protein (TIGR02220 family)